MYTYAYIYNVKVKIVFVQGINAYRGVELYVHSFLTLALDNILSDSQTGYFNPGESAPFSKWIAIYLVYRAGLDSWSGEMCLATAGNQPKIPRSSSRNLSAFDCAIPAADITVVTNVVL